MNSWTDKKAWLEARRAELVAEMREIEDKLDDAPPKDWEDRASERQGDEVLESLGAHDDADLRQIDAALVRLAEDDYGFCVACGAVISTERLNALPATPFCKNCAR